MHDKGSNETMLTRRETRESLQELEAKSLAKSLPEGINIDNKIFREKTIKYFPIYLNIINGAIWGVLARRGLNVLTVFDGSYLGGVIWANFAACFVMGLVVDSYNVWSKLAKEEHYGNKGAIPLYIGITTGFCGTCSSYSSLILEAYTKASNVAKSDFPNPAYGIMQFLSVILGQLGVSIFGFHVGKNIIEMVDSKVPKMSKSVYACLETGSMILGFSAYVVSLVLVGVLHSWRPWMFSVIFAPVGALGRFYISKYFNTRIKNFPLGTFMVNVFGTLILSILNLVMQGGGTSHGRILRSYIGCQVITGLDDGFCGALTTVSTFVVEMFTLKTIDRWRYVIVSVSISFTLVVITLGAYDWSVGLVEALC